jgi:hypothetical protein
MGDHAGRPVLRLWLRWMMANSLAVGAAFVLVALALLSPIGYALLDSGYVFLLCAASLVVAAAQCLVLRPYGLPIRQWVAVTVVGILLGALLPLLLMVFANGFDGSLDGIERQARSGTVVGTIIAFYLTPVLTGVGCGIVQAFILRSAVGRFGWWIPATLIASLLAVPVTWAALVTTWISLWQGPFPGERPGLGAGVVLVLSMLVVMAVGSLSGAIYGGITGVVLARLLAGRQT